MKSTSTPNPARPSKYPYLMKHKGTSTIVMFIDDPSVGVVVHVGDPSIHTLGEFSNCWDETHFDPFDGEVTLSSD